MPCVPEITSSYYLIRQGDALLHPWRTYAKAARLSQIGVHSLRQRAYARAMHVRNSGARTPGQRMYAKTAPEREGGARTLRWCANARAARVCHSGMCAHQRHECEPAVACVRISGASAHRRRPSNLVACFHLIFYINRF